VSVVLISTGRGVFIGVQGGVTDLVKLVTHQVMAGRPWGPASTDIWLWIPYYRLLESVTLKPTHERLQCGASRLGGMAGRHALSPLLSGLCTLPPHVRYIPGVTLILVEF
jgi:hypothetical protein